MFCHSIWHVACPACGAGDISGPGVPHSIRSWTRNIETLTWQVGKKGFDPWTCLFERQLDELDE